METHEIKGVLDGIRSGIADFDKKFNGLQTRMDGIEMKLVQVPGHGSPSAGGAEWLTKAFQGSEDLQALMGGRRKSAIIKITEVPLNLKTTITSGAVGSGTSGVLMPERIDGVVSLAQRRNFMRDILRTVPTKASAVDFVKEQAFTNAASPHVETELKGESNLTFTTEVAPVRTLAHWIPASKQVLDDFEALMMTVQRKLIYGLMIEEDRQIISGDGLGQNLSGLTVEATAFNTSLLHASNGWEKADILRRAIQQVDRADEAATGWFALHPDDWADIELTKDSQGNYIAGSPRSMIAPTLWGKPVAVSTGMTSGHFLAGSSEAADIRMRQEITVEVSTEHADYFTRNLVAIRCEERLAMPIYRPAALIYGAFTTSPA